MYPDLMHPPCMYLDLNQREESQRLVLHTLYYGKITTRFFAFATIYKSLGSSRAAIVSHKQWFLYDDLLFWEFSQYYCVIHFFGLSFSDELIEVLECVI